MKRILVSATNPEETTVAFVDNRTLYDLDIESQTNRHFLENIYKARVARVQPGMYAAFIDYGHEKLGLLSFKHLAGKKLNNLNSSEASQKDPVLSEGEEILVQISKDEREKKGAQLTTDISLISQHLILYPNNPYPNQKLSGYIQPKNRQIIYSAASDIKLSLPQGMGLILKSSSNKSTEGILLKELSWLLEIWEKIKLANEDKNHPYPTLLYRRESSPFHVLRNYTGDPVDEIITDNEKTFEAITAYAEWCLPEYKDKIFLHQEKVSLFKYYDIEHSIEATFENTVKLRSGGNIVIDNTEALTAIDVNSAQAKGSDPREMALKTNLEAVKEIAKQIKLRDLGGLIVIDLIGMSDKETQEDAQKIYDHMKDELRSDRALTRLEEISSFGLLQIERQRLRSSLSETVSTKCPHCKGKGYTLNTEHIALKIIHEISDHALRDDVAQIDLKISPDVMTYIFNNKKAKLNDIESDNNIAISVTAETRFDSTQFEIKAFSENKTPLITRAYKPKKDKSKKQHTGELDKPVIKAVEKSTPGLFSFLVSKVFSSDKSIPLDKKHSNRNKNTRKPTHKSNIKDSNKLKNTRRTKNKNTPINKNISNRNESKEALAKSTPNRSQKSGLNRQEKTTRKNENSNKRNSKNTISNGSGSSDVIAEEKKISPINHALDANNLPNETVGIGSRPEQEQQPTLRPLNDPRA